MTISIQARGHFILPDCFLCFVGYWGSLHRLQSSKY